MKTQIELLSELIDTPSSEFSNLKSEECTPILQAAFIITMKWTGTKLTVQELCSVDPENYEECIEMSKEENKTCEKFINDFNFSLPHLKKSDTTQEEFVSLIKQFKFNIPISEFQFVDPKDYSFMVQGFFITLMKSIDVSPSINELWNVELSEYKKYKKIYNFLRNPGKSLKMSVFFCYLSVYLCFLPIVSEFFSICGITKAVRIKKWVSEKPTNKMLNVAIFVGICGIIINIAIIFAICFSIYTNLKLQELHNI